MDNTRWSVEQLEGCTTHELADLPSNLVLLLRRLPDVPMSELGQGHHESCRCGNCEKCQIAWQKFIGVEVE